MGKLRQYLLKLKQYILLLVLVEYCACSRYLDIVPDDVATIESAFTLRVTAERYLFTCYSWLPAKMDLTGDPAMLGGGELTSLYPYNTIAGFLYSRGEQNSLSPLLNYWSGLRGGNALFQGIRDCNIFLENIDHVFDIGEEERSRWIAEVKFLKAYYHFHLLKQYGPIPLIKENMPISAGIDEVKVYRDPVDDCFAYIEELLNEAMPDLPVIITDVAFEMGRITRPIASSVKANVLVTAASPFYNGNTDYADFRDNKGDILFNQAYDREKWKRALDACQEAIDLCHSIGMQLYRFQPVFGQTVSEATMYQMNVRSSVCERWNSELIWGGTNSTINQAGMTPRSWDPSIASQGTTGRYGPGIEFANLFYTKNGVPIEEDETWDYGGRYNLQIAAANDRYNIRQGYTTVKMNFDRENRFYASLGFDGGIWYGQGRYDDNNTWVIEGKIGQSAGITILTNHTPTGYWPKKLIHYQNVVSTTGTAGYSVTWYPVPYIRLADLYLLYSEAYNEYFGPGNEVYQYLNTIRERSGLPTVQDAWTQYSRNPTKYQNKDGLREIIHQERQIELAFEASRLWDLRRWKKMLVELNKPILGWSLNQSTAENYYRETTVFRPQVSFRNYLEPIRESDVLVNSNLVQNPGW